MTTEKDKLLTPEFEFTEGQHTTSLNLGMTPEAMRNSSLLLAN